MPVSARQAQLVRESFAQLRRRLEPASMAFYEALFRRDPSLRGLFRDDLAGQGMKFMSALGTVVEHIERPAELGDRFAELGSVHALIGVRAADFEPMGEALVETLRDELGAAFDAEMETAWRAAYGELAERMIRRGGIA